MGIGPTWSAWKAEVLPLNYIRINLYQPSFFSEDNNNYYEIKYFLNEEPNQKKENQNSNHTSKLDEKLNSKKLLISNKYRVNDIIVHVIRREI